jgi:hypothetical protein
MTRYEFHGKEGSRFESARGLASFAGFFGVAEQRARRLA